MKININGKIIEVENDIISKAIEDKSEEISIKDAPFVIRTAEEDTTFKNNYKDENIKIGAEIGRKELFKKLGIEKEGVHKSDELAASTLTEWATSFADKKLEEAKIEPNKKVEELTKDLRTLKSTIATKDSELSKVMNEFSTFQKSSILNSFFDSNFPENLAYSKEDMKVIINNKQNFDVNENQEVLGFGADGQLLKNPTTLEPLKGKEVLDMFFNDNPQYLKTSSGGAGGTDSTGGHDANSLVAFEKEMEAKGIGAGSEQFNTELNNRIKSGAIKI
jgi:hypothetical protein